MMLVHLENTPDVSEECCTELNSAETAGAPPWFGVPESITDLEEP